VYPTEYLSSSASPHARTKQINDNGEESRDLTVAVGVERDLGATDQREDQRKRERPDGEHIRRLLEEGIHQLHQVQSIHVRRQDAGRQGGHHAVRGHHRGEELQCGRGRAKVGCRASPSSHSSSTLRRTVVTYLRIFGRSIESSDLDTLLFDRLGRFLRTHTVKVDLKGSDILGAIESVGRNFEDYSDNAVESRGKKSKYTLMRRLSC